MFNNNIIHLIWIIIVYGIIYSVQWQPAGFPLNRFCYSRNLNNTLYYKKTRGLVLLPMIFGQPISGICSQKLEISIKFSEFLVKSWFALSRRPYHSMSMECVSGIINKKKRKIQKSFPDIKRLKILKIWS